jgi:glucose repression regulatory protein TUP1
MSAGPSNGRLPQTGPGLPPPATPTNGDYPMGDATIFVRGGPPSSIPDTDYTEEFDPATAPPERKKDGGDWWAVWSSKSKRVLDVNLVHTLTHDTSVVRR